ncbi:outer membrane beta-barrel protein [Flavobacteriaceae bacterium]|nr:PorT family protein [Flavobacteriaceae bacterium]MDC1060812.1 outer membrane beta-barrel protein [Flavobacteriaceae bacterium]
MRVIFFLFCFLCIGLLLGQEKDSLSYNEDQFYIDVNFIIQSNEVNLFQENGFSRSIHAGFLRDFSFTKKGDKAIAIGLGYGYERLVNNLNIRKNENELNYSFPTNGISLRNSFSVHQLQLPIELRWRTSTIDNYRFWRIYLGYRLSYHFTPTYKPFFGRSFSIKNQIQDWQHSLSLSVGFNTWNLRFSYSLSPFLAKTVQTQEGIRPKVNPVQVGLIFYLL